MLDKAFLFSGAWHNAHKAAAAASPTTPPSRHWSRSTRPASTTGDAGVGPAQRQTRDNARADRSRRRRLLGLDGGPGEAQSSIICHEKKFLDFDDQQEKEGERTHGTHVYI